MKFSKLILGAAILFSAQIASVQGKNACDPCAVQNPCDLCNINFCDIEYSAYADALFWEVGKGDLNVGRTDADNTEKYLNPEFSWGYRVGAMAHWKNWDLGVRWTALETSTTSRYAFQETGHAKFSFDYKVLDVEVGYTCHMECGPFSFRPFVGAKSAWIEDHFDKSSGGQSDSKIENESYGLYIGSCGRWELCNFNMCDRNMPISLVARASTGVLRSEFSQRVRDNGNRDIDWEHIYTPYNDVYVGLDFTFCDLCGADAFFQIGYEAQSFAWREYNDAEDVTYLGLGGLVIRLGADF